MPISYVTGDATHPQGQGPAIILHCCNDLGVWGAGFVLALSAAWPMAEAAYKAWPDADPGLPWTPPTIETTGRFVLGEVQFVLVAPSVWVANLIGQHGTGRGEDGRAPIRYEAIKLGLQKVAKFAKSKGAAVHMPRMGSGLAGGRWDAVEQLVNAHLHDAGVAVTVYDLPQQAPRP